MKRIYIYLAKRDKKGLKILLVLKGQSHPPARIIDIAQLALPNDLEQKISKQIHLDRMLWEPWIESADDYVQLKTSLRNRGYLGLPMCSSPLFESNLESVIKKSQQHLEPTIKPIETEPTSMLRRLNP